MTKKLILVIIGILLFNIFTASSVSAKPLDKITDGIEDLLKIKSDLQITIDEDLSEKEIYMRQDSYINVNVTVKYKLDARPFLSKLLLDTKVGRFLLLQDPAEDPQMKIEIKGTANASWCHIADKTKTVSVNLSNEYQEITHTFKISVDPDADPFKKAEVKFTAQSKEGDFRIEPATDEVKLNIISGCRVGIQLSCIHMDAVKPGEESIMPITIQNLGDVETTVDVEFLNTAETWEVTKNITSFNLEPDGKKTIKIQIKAKSANSKDEIVTIKFSPRATKDIGVEDESLKGQDKSLDIKLIGTNIKSSNSNPFGLPGFEMLLMLIAISVIFVAIKRKKQL